MEALTCWGAREGWVCGGYYRCTGAIFQAFLILNVLSLKLLIEVSGCFVSMAAESTEQIWGAAQCWVLGLPHVPETRSCVCNHHRIWRTWRWMKKLNLRKVMRMSRNSKRMNCKEKTELHHPKKSDTKLAAVMQPSESETH